MKLDTSWESNKKSLIAVIFGLSILFSVRILHFGIIGGAVVGAIIGGFFYLIFDKISLKAKRETQEIKEEARK